MQEGSSSPPAPTRCTTALPLLHPYSLELYMMNSSTGELQIKITRNNTSCYIRPNGFQKCPTSKFLHCLKLDLLLTNRPQLSVSQAEPRSPLRPQNALVLPSSSILVSISEEAITTPSCPLPFFLFSHRLRLRSSVGNHTPRHPATRTISVWSRETPEQTPVSRCAVPAACNIRSCSSTDLRFTADPNLGKGSVRLNLK